MIKILFIMANPTYIRNYQSTVQVLSDQGHDIEIIFNSLKDNHLLPKTIDLGLAKVNYTYQSNQENTYLWQSIVTLVRACKNYLRYLYPEYKYAYKLRERVKKQLFIFPFIAPVLYLFKLIPNFWGLKIISRLLDLIESTIPANQDLVNFLSCQNPDLILITPLVDFDAQQTDYLKAAQKLGIKCAMCVHSWDNLTNKGAIQIKPDRIFLWNNIQKQEAIRLHNIAEETIIITGAQCYDKWFTRKPSLSKELFLDKVELDKDKPYILYLCSSSFIAPDEVTFVQDWLKQIRHSSNIQLQSIGVLIRPHPQNSQQWQNTHLDHWQNAVIWPLNGENPVHEDAQANFYDSIYYSIAVVGINTSAMIESGILGKPVYTILDQRFKDTQEGTIHFHHLVKGGLLQISSGLTEHEEQLIIMLQGNLEDYQEKIKTFIHKFVRPHGLTNPATPILVDNIKNMLVLPSIELSILPCWIKILRLVLLPIAFLIEQLRLFYKKIKALIPNRKNMI